MERERKQIKNKGGKSSHGNWDCAQMMILFGMRSCLHKRERQRERILRFASDPRQMRSILDGPQKYIKYNT